MRIVTKRGDKGMTGNLKGDRIPKNSDEIEFVGALDELQSFLGILESTHEIQEIQYDIYNIMGFNNVEVSKIDGYILKLDIPIINKFIIPTGWIHVCRAVARRAERRAVGISPNAVQYLNRLSDYLYILSFNK